MFFNMIHLIVINLNVKTIKKTIILLVMLALTISCNSGEDYVGKCYNKNNNRHITIIKAGEKGCIIRL